MTKKTEPVDKKDEGYPKQDKIILAVILSCLATSVILYYKGMISLTTLMYMSIIPLGLINFINEVIN